MEYNIDKCPIVGVQLRKNGKTNCPARDANYNKCPVATFQRIISGQWQLVILWLLRQGAKSDKMLAGLLPQIPPDILAENLDALKADAFICRQNNAEYTLTVLGDSFSKIIDDVEEWGKQYMEATKG